MGRCRSITVDMPDGSKVVLRAQMTHPDAKLTARDIEALRECIHAISERRMDPQRMDRRRRDYYRTLPEGTDDVE